MGFIRVTKDGWGFEDAATGERFVPLGTNYAATIQRVPEAGYCGQISQLFGTDEFTEADPVDEARRMFSRIADLGLNVVRLWLEPTEFFPVGTRLDPYNAERFDRVLDAATEFGIRVSIDVHAYPLGSKSHSMGNLRVFEPPVRERFDAMRYALASRWGDNEAIFSWTIVGEGTLPWCTKWIASHWPTWLEYWYDGDLKLLREAWGDVRVDSFADAPVPPVNLGKTLPISALSPANLDSFPHDPWANSTWRYDWRLMLEEIGSQWVREQSRTIRAAGAKQMITVGNNSWTFPGLAAGQMALGFDPYHYLDCVDYLCQHNYPAPQCLPGGNGDPLDNEEAMTFWLNSCEIMARIYGSLGKPVVLEEWGWYGGAESRFLTPLPYRSEEDQQRFCDRMMEMSRHCYAGWFYWQWRDMPRANDITDYSAIYAANGNRVKAWGTSYGQWATRLKADPPVRAEAKTVIDLDMQMMYTADVDHERFYQQTAAGYDKAGPLDFRQVFPHKPLITHVAKPADPKDGDRVVQTPMGEMNE